MPERDETLPVVAEARPLDRPAAPAPLPVPVQAAAVAATGFLAGAGLTALLRRVRGGRRRAGRRRLRRRDRRELGIVGSRSFLVDVHVLDPRR